MSWRGRQLKRPRIRAGGFYFSCGFATRSRTLRAQISRLCRSRTRIDKTAMLRRLPPSRDYWGFPWRVMGPILGDPGGVSRVGRKDGTKVFKYGWKSPWVPTLIKLFPKIQADAGSWLGTKNVLYYCAQLANSFSWVLFVSSYTRAIVLLHLPSSFTKLVRTRETFIFYFPNQKRRNYRWVEKTFGMLSTGAIQFAPRTFCFWLITIYHK